MAKKKSSKAKVQEETSDRTENIIAIGTIVVILVLAVGFWNNWFGLFSGTTSPTGNPVVSTSAMGEPAKGDTNAPITIVEYSDFECPFCGRFASEVYPALKEQFIDTGRVRFVYKQFPLTQIHQRAMPAAIASECVYLQGEEMFWDYHDLLFQFQALDDESLKQYAQQVGADQQQFDLCFSNGATRGEVEEDYRQGVDAGVTGTPAFVIGKTGPTVRGELLVGAQPIMRFIEVIERIE